MPGTGLVYRLTCTPSDQPDNAKLIDMKLITLDSEKDISRCYEVLLEFRTNLKKENIAAQFAEMLAEGYELVYCLDEATHEVAGFIGFRRLNMFLNGRIIYIDDLFVLPRFRGKGYASALLDHVHQLAATEKMDAVHLDSGYTRTDAHRLYLNKGYIMQCMHFVHKLN